MKILQKSIAILLGGIVMGALLLTLVYMLPMSEESTNAAASMEILNTEGWYPTLPLTKSFEGTISRLNAGGILDNFTDSIMISTSAKDPGRRPLYQAMKMENSVIGSGYSYYWHGYVTILRPLLLLADYGEIRVLNEMLQMMLVLWLFCLLKQRKGLVWAMLSLSVYGLLYPMTLAYSLQYSWVFYITMLISVVMLKFEETWKQNNNILLLFLVSGMLTSYLDLLTYPLITWGIPMIWWIALDDEGNTEISRLKKVVFCGLSWILGYGGMWAGKWLLGEVLLREPVVATAWNEVLFRAGAITGTEGCDASHWDTILRNFAQCDNMQYLLVLILWFVWILYKAIKRKGVLQTIKTPAFMLIAVSTFAWYIVLHNHTFVHASFTYRIFVVFTIAVLAGMISALEERENVLGEVLASKWQCLISLLVVIVTILIVLTDRESVWKHNGEVEGVHLRLKNGECVIQEFVPDHSRIEKIYLGIAAEDNMEGVFVVEVYQGDYVLAEKRIPASEVGNSGFFEIPLEMKLKKDVSYRIQISLSENEKAKGWVYVTPKGNYTLAEFRSVEVGGRQHDRQLLGGLTYNILENKSKLLLDFITLASGLEVLVLSIQQMIKSVKNKDNNCKISLASFRHIW